MKQITNSRGLILVVAAALLLVGLPAQAQAPDKKPNILIIWGDDIGQFNLSAYNMGMMGYRTPHIDSLAHEGALFTDWYGQQSCTAGRAAFITGQSPIRTALVTARASPAHERVIRTLRAWNVVIDETFFMGGVEKSAILEAFQPHMFFDDQIVHCQLAAPLVPTGRVPGFKKD